MGSQKMGELPRVRSRARHTLRTADTGADFQLYVEAIQYTSAHLFFSLSLSFFSSSSLDRAH